MTARFSRQDYGAAGRALLPRGLAWSQDSGSAQDVVLTSFGATFERSDDAASQFLDGSLPARALALLPEWEWSTGLPDPCIGEAQTLQVRRQRVVQQVAGLGGQSRAYFLSVADGLGFTGCSITEFAVMTCGSPCTSSINADPWQFTWRLNVPAGADVRSMTAGAGCDEPIRTWGNIALECVMRRLKPAHTNLLFAYGS